MLLNGSNPCDSSDYSYRRSCRYRDFCESRWFPRSYDLPHDVSVPALSLAPHPVVASTPWFAVPRAAPRHVSAPRSVLLPQRRRLRCGRDPTPKVPQGHLQERGVSVPSDGLLARVPPAVSTRANPVGRRSPQPLACMFSNLFRRWSLHER